jgi:hypothetical protein
MLTIYPDDLKYYFLTYKNIVRKEHMLKEFEGLDITEVNSIDAPKFSSGAAGYCQMLLKGSEQQDPNKPFQPFVVMEDDVKKYRKFPHCIRIPVDADLLYIGLSKCSLNWISPKKCSLEYNVIYDNVDSDLVRVYNMLSTHGIVVCSAKGLAFLVKVMMEAYFKNVVWDVPLAWGQYSLKAYALRVPLVYQWREVGGKEDATKVEFLEDSNPLPSDWGDKVIRHKFESLVVKE